MAGYSLQGMPVATEFFQSQAFMQALLGPFGSGKSSVCVMKIGKLGVQQAPGPDGVRRSRFVVIRNCFDADTEILTEKRGWQKFAELLDDDAVATLQDGRRLVYEVPTYHYAAPYRGEMIGLKAEGLDMLVTPTHHMWTTKTSGRRREVQPYRHVRACDMFGMIDWRFKRDADEWVGSAAPRYSEAMFELLGFWFAEGYAGRYEYADRSEPHWRWVISQKNEIPYLRGLLAAAGLTAGEYHKGGENYNFAIHIPPEYKPLVAELAAQAGAANKFVPSWIKDAPGAHIRAFLRGYLMGDGNLGNADRDCTLAQTISKQLADDIQECAFRVGQVVNVRAAYTYEINGETRQMWTMTFISSKKYSPKSGKHWFKINYDGMVHCVEVSSHVVYVRRNGIAAWSGQTYKELEDTTEKTFLQWFSPHIHGVWVPSKHNFHIRSLKAAANEPSAEIEINFRALDRPDQVSSLLSLELTGGWINEAREVPWAIVEALQGRVGRYPAIRDGGATWSGILMDTNPPDSDSDFYRFFEEQKGWDEAIEALAEVVPGMTREKFAQIFKQPSGLSPEAENLANLQPGYYQRLAVGKSDEWIKVYIRGQYGFIADGRAVFPEYNDNFHCSQNPEKGPRISRDVEVIRSWDFGLTPACVFSQITADGRWIIVDELISTRMGADAFSDEVLRHSSAHYRGCVFVDVGDPAGQQGAQTDERTCFQVLQGKGIDIQAAPQTLQLRLEGTRRPLRMLVDGRPQFFMHPRCRILRRAMQGGYHFRRLRVSGESYTAQPNKNQYSHVADALTYAGAWIFGSQVLGAGNMGSDGGQDSRRARDDRTRSRVTGY